MLQFQHIELDAETVEGSRRDYCEYAARRIETDLGRSCENMTPDGGAGRVTPL